MKADFTFDSAKNILEDFLHNASSATIRDLAKDEHILSVIELTCQIAHRWNNEWDEATDTLVHVAYFDITELEAWCEDRADELRTTNVFLHAIIS